MPRKKHSNSSTLNLIPEGMSGRRAPNPSGRNQWSKSSNVRATNNTTNKVMQTTNNYPDATMSFNWKGTTFNFFPDGSFQIIPPTKY